MGGAVTVPFGPSIAFKRKDGNLASDWLGDITWLMSRFLLV